MMACPTFDEFMVERSENQKELLEKPIRTEQGNLVLLDISNPEKIVGSACVLCFSLTNRNPYKGCREGGYVHTICSRCLEHYIKIKNYIEEDKHMKMVESLGEDAHKILKRKRRNKQLVQKKLERFRMDLPKIKKEIASGTAKMSKLAQEYDIFPNEAKEILVEEFGDDLVFKKGRHGGVFLKA